MRKASHAFLKLGAIFGIILGVLYIGLGIAGIIVGKTNLTPELLEAFREVIRMFFNNDPVKFQQGAFLYGVILLIAGIASFASAIICIMAKNQKKNGLYITVIVLALIGGSAFGVLGAIFGLVANGQDNRAKLNQPKEEVKSEPQETEPTEENKD